MGALERSFLGSNPGIATSQLCNLRHVLNISGLWFPLGIIESPLSRNKWANVCRAPNKCPFPARCYVKHSFIF